MLHLDVLEHLICELDGIALSGFRGAFHLKINFSHWFKCILTFLEKATAGISVFAEKKNVVICIECKDKWSC